MPVMLDDSAPVVPAGNEVTSLGKLKPRQASDDGDSRELVSFPLERRTQEG